MAHLSTDLPTLELNLRELRSRIAGACTRAGRERSSVVVCAATKYVDEQGLQLLSAAGVTVAGENRLQDLIAKQERYRDEFEWHFIGAIQSRKIREIASRVSVIHSLASESARDRLVDLPGAPPRILVQVNVSGEESKQGVRPEQLGAFIAATPIPVSGLTTMPPASDDPEEARPHFARLRELADEHDLTELSMGTSQDYLVAIEEGATMIRVGSVLFSPAGK